MRKEIQNKSFDIIKNKDIFSKITLISSKFCEGVKKVATYINGHNLLNKSCKWANDFPAVRVPICYVY
jgi:hypothetical protein